MASITITVHTSDITRNLTTEQRTELVKHLFHAQALLYASYSEMNIDASQKVCDLIRVIDPSFGTLQIPEVVGGD
jgi:uncharacterized tellurite resistance protein B-like protein